MIEYTQLDLIAALEKVGLKSGDIVLVSTELFTLGRLMGANNKEEYCRMVYEAIFEVIKKQGTLVVNAFTTYVGRYGDIYDHNHSKPTTGSFSEYILSRPDSVRSLHPIDSLAAVGGRKQEICSNVSTSNYGLDSPYDRFVKRKGQVLRLGIDYVHNSLLHMVETIYGLPYIYNKLLDAEVIFNGQKIDKPFFAAVRYLEYPLEYSFDDLRQALEKSDIVHSAKVGGNSVHRLDANAYCELLIELLKGNPYVFLKQPPPFKKGEKPWDGITSGRDGVHKYSDYRKGAK